MKIYYKSLFNGWVEINPIQKEKLEQYMKNGITALSNEEKIKYINSRFKTIK